MNRRSFRSLGREVVVAGADARTLAAIRRLFDERDRSFLPACAGSAADPSSPVPDPAQILVEATAVDDALSLLPGAGFVSASGCLAARGAPVSVELPDGERVVLEAGGIATGERLDREADSPWLQVTAIGPSCRAAAAAAGTGLLLGHDGPERLDALGVAGRFLGADGVVVQNGRWNRSLAQLAA